MKLLDAIKYAIDGKAILFVGSGFGYGATNTNGGSFVTGNGLRDALLKDLGMDPKSTSASLSTVSDYYLKSKSSSELIGFFKKQFHTQDSKEWHDIILSIDWKRVYTTNYDNLIESSALKSHKTLVPVLAKHSTQEHKYEKVCVHLNGYIDYLDNNSFESDLKLTDYSYNKDALSGKPWFEFMKSDIKSAKAIIVIGFSMTYDLDITRLLSTPDISNKVVFIDRSGADELDISRFKNYGTYYGIGIDNFAKKTEKQKSVFVPAVFENLYESFLHENLSPLFPEKISYDDLFKLFFFGKYKDSLCEKEQFGKYYGDYKYLVLRKAVDVVTKNLYSKKVFIATSNLGNGKSVFCNLVRNELRDKDIHVFMFSKRLAELDEEIGSICRIKDKHCVVIIDNYQSKLDILKRFYEYGDDNITYVLTARKAINSPNYRKLLNILKIDDAELKPIYLDYLNDEECEKLSEVFLKNNILSEQFESTEKSIIMEYLEKKCHSEFSLILLSAFNSSDIKQKIIDNYSKLAVDNNTKIVVIFALMREVMNLDVDFYDIITLLNLDYIVLSAKTNVFINEFFDVYDNDINIRSSIIAKELLYNTVGIHDVLDTIKIIVFALDKLYKVNPSYKNILQNLVSHTHFVPFLKQTNAISAIKNFYNEIRNTSFCSQGNPFFWEQFASVCIDAKDFDEAEQCLSAAFLKAKDIPGFIPFQIETIKARCLIERLLYDSTFSLYDSEKAIQILCDCHERLMKYYDHPDNNINYVFSIGIKYKDFFNLYKDKLDKRQQSIFIEKKSIMIKKMETEKDTYNLSNKIEQLRDCVF